jgi:hypothetical protein
MANPFEKKLLDWQIKLDALERKISSLQDITFLSLLCKLVKSDNLDSLYSEMDKIKSEIGSSMDTFSARSSEDLDYNLYLSRMSEAMLRIENLRSDLSKKDSKQYIQKFQLSKKGSSQN